MKEIENLSDLINAIKFGSSSSPEEGPLFDLYLTLKSTEKDVDFYEGRGIFRDTKLYFLNNKSFLPMAPCIQNEDLDLEELMKNDDRLVLEVKTTYEYEYSSTQRIDSKTLKDWVEVKDGQVYIGGVKPEERNAKKIIKDLNSSVLN